MKFIKVLKKPNAQKPPNQIGQTVDLSGTLPTEKTKAAISDPRPGGGCIPISGLDR